MTRFFLFLISIVLMFGCSSTQHEAIVQSPNQEIELQFFLSESNQPSYSIQYNNQVVIDSSAISFDFKDIPAFQNDFTIIKVEKNTVNETWEPFWGEDEKVKNHYNEIKVFLQESTQLKREWNIIFRVFDDGVGFRYEFPEQEHLSEVTITEENTEFNLTGDHYVWWIPGDWDNYEYPYNHGRLSQVDALAHFKPESQSGRTFIKTNAVNTPVTMKTDQGIYLSFHEADLTDYAGITLAVDTTNFRLKSALVGNAKNNNKVVRKAPFHTPWRTVQIASKPGDLIESKLILNLNEPSVIDNMDYFKPTKYVGIWWDMHIGTRTWDLTDKHGATTEYAKELIDFAAQNNIHAILVEGWNTGWENWWDKENKASPFDFVKSYPDYDLEEVVRYGKEKGVELIMHHETSADVTGYEAQMDSAFALMQNLGIHAVKTGYVGYTIPKGEFHHGQWMVNHYHKVLEYGVKNQVAINAHEPIMATGKRRTYPVAISREGLRGQEYNAWSGDGGNPPEHLAIVPFTRMLAGPVDFTPGIFDLTLPTRPKNQVNTTLAKQLAAYVVIYSPIQMVPDLIENYKGHPAFQFIRDVAVDWKQSKVLDAEIGEYIVMARQEKSGERWFVGGLTNEAERDVLVKFDFLIPNKSYLAKVYRDAKDSHYRNNPKAYAIDTIEINSTSELPLHMAPGGGFAISIQPKEE